MHTSYTQLYYTDYAPNKEASLKYRQRQTTLEPLHCPVYEQQYASARVNVYVFHTHTNNYIYI